MLCWFPLHSKVNQLYVYIHPLSFGFSSHLGHHGTLSYTVGSLLVVYFIYSSVYTEKAMAPHSSTPAWKIPWMEEPGGLQSMGSHRVGQDWSDSAAAAAAQASWHRMTGNKSLGYKCDKPLFGGKFPWNWMVLKSWDWPTSSILLGWTLQDFDILGRFWRQTTF